MQRLLDIIFSSLALIVLSPVMLIVSIILRLTGEGEIFYLQERVGKDMDIFKLYKFATMLKNSENIGSGTVTVKNDPRVLPLGKFLRSTKINELPQLINIFIGDMSVIGPRPQTRRCFNAFPDAFKDTIASVKPGLSGIGSIIFRAEEDLLESDLGTNINFYDDIISPYKAEIESWYIPNRNVKTYFLLIFLTIWIVIFSRSNIVWKLIKDIPEPPEALQSKLKFNAK
jgi:lipopolysaccharide/colanic/teichoic acid biosynthesis glycosyltransferase